MTTLISASVELLKAFGLKVFLAALGDSLQDWLRVLLYHCGAPSASVRVASLEFMALLLRACWTSYGSLTKIRVPCLATFLEVIEKTVSAAGGDRGGGREDVNEVRRERGGGGGVGGGLLIKI
jgi:hypothetical protein